MVPHTEAQPWNVPTLNPVECGIPLQLGHVESWLPYPRSLGIVCNVSTCPRPAFRATNLACADEDSASCSIAVSSWLYTQATRSHQVPWPQRIRKQLGATSQPPHCHQVDCLLFLHQQQVGMEPSMDPVERLALATREARFGEHGGVNPSVEVSTTFTGGC